MIREYKLALVCKVYTHAKWYVSSISATGKWRVLVNARLRMEVINASLPISNLKLCVLRNNIKTSDSESRGQEEAECDE